jgi:hypothetical protein
MGLIGAVLGVLVVLALVAMLVWQRGDGDETSSGTTAPPTTAAPTTVATTAPPTTAAPTTTVAPAPGVDTATAVYPFGPAGSGFDDPVALVSAFAQDWIGFTDPIVGEFMAGDSRSGEVEVRPLADGPVTMVFVRQLGPDNSWWVLGTATANITVDQPSTGATVSSPVTVSGNALAFEGNVAVEVRQDGSVEPIGSRTVTGGGDVMRPFQGQIQYSTPSQQYGALVFMTRSAMDGRVWEAAVLRVQFS